MGIFKKIFGTQRKASPTEPTHQQVIDQTDARLVEAEILLATAAVAEQVSEVFEIEDGAMRWMVSLQVLSFFLHYMNRRAFAKKGPDFRAAIQDTITVSSIERLYDSSWDTSNVKPGFDKEAFKQRAIEDSIEFINDAEEELSTCKEIFSDIATARDTVLGCYTAGLLTGIGESDTHPLGLLVATTTLEALTKSNIANCIDGAHLIS